MTHIRQKHPLIQQDKKQTMPTIQSINNQPPTTPMTQQPDSSCVQIALVFSGCKGFLLAVVFLLSPFLLSYILQKLDQPTNRFVPNNEQQAATPQNSETEIKCKVTSKSPSQLPPCNQ